MKCTYAAFGEQNKTDNDSKCQLVYKSLNNQKSRLTRGWHDFLMGCNACAIRNALWLLVGTIADDDELSVLIEEVIKISRKIKKMQFIFGYFIVFLYLYSQK